MTPKKSGALRVRDRHSPPRAVRRSLVASVVGNALEWYDWNVYAVFATFLASALFDKSDPLSALLSTFAVFAVGFVTRPLGGVLFGALADRIGRRAVLVATMLLTAASSLVVGLTPGYDSIGVWSSVLLLLARLAQGLGHGGESAAAFAYVSELAPPARRGLWSSSVFTGVSAGTLLATGLGAVLTAVLPTEALASWGWRVPFMVGGLLGVFALHLRRTAVESDVFEEQQSADGGGTAAAERAAWPRRRLIGAGLRIVIITASIGVMYYSWIVFGAGNAVSRHGMPANEAFTAGFAAQFIGLLSLPLWGRLSDRYGRRPLALGYALGCAVFAFPITLMVGAEPETLFASELSAVLLWAMMAAIYPALVSEMLPTNFRSKGIGIATSLANTVFGGSAPYLGQLLENAGLSWIFTLYATVLCLLSAVAALTMRETRGIDLAGMK
ncbi:MFS transporter [Streptomyces sp. NPDC088745]|uniref:MFS transporter n=1 Tax=Streptomyces sp. NPDC088745 TaxID=3365884 RepID=UPI003822ACD4